MKAEHWELDDGCVIFESDNPSKDFLIKGGKFCCFIEGQDWTDIMTKYHEHMGWEPYEPMEDL